MTQEIDKFYTCNDKHHMVIQRVRSGTGSTARGETKFFRICKFCGLLETKIVQMKKTKAGDFIPQVELFLSFAGKNISMPVKTYRLVHQSGQNQPPGDKT